MNRISRTFLGFVRGPVFALLACTGAAAFVGAAPALAAPAIDGNLDDMISFAQTLHNSRTGCGLYITDKPDANGNPTPETIYNDLKFIPCPQPQPTLGTHWVNGIEIFKHVLAYEPGSTSLYLGIRAEGMIGDSDGNGNPDNAGGGSCNPNDNVKDTTGISGNELYAWSFDLDCDGSTDGTIKIQDNTVTGTGTLAGATGTFAFRAGGSATGHDLEVQVTLAAPLPPAFNYLRVEANAFDGLSEDRSDGDVCVGNPKITVAKSATPTVVCVGKTTRFTVTVNNPGSAPLSVVVVDQLPTQLSYAANLSSSCGVAAPVVNGQTLTFPAFTLAAGANCTISFDVLASAQCSGSQNNLVDVTGTFSSACIPKTGSVSTTAHAEFAVTCQAGPCVSVTATGPPSACTGAAITISGTATNCSTASEPVVVTVNGAQAYSNNVGAGQTVNWTYNTTMPTCTAGTSVTFNVQASATNDCGTDSKPATVVVPCGEKPCFELGGSGPSSACPGTPITISGTVRNCSTSTETITVTVDGQQAFSGSVAAGATQNWTIQLPMKQCSTGQSVSYAVSATASSNCGTDTKTATVNVACGAPPCVTIDVNAPPVACAGTTIQLCGSVTNCSTGPETIEVSYGGSTQRYENVPAGSKQTFCFSVVMGNCSTSDTQTFTVTAAAINGCGRVEKTAVDETKCKLPLLKVKKAGEGTIADGGIIHYTIIVENPGEVDLQNVIITDTMCRYTVYNNNANPPTFSAPAVGSNGTVVWHVDLLKAQESRAFTFEAKASLAAGGYTGCPAPATCMNGVDAVGSCAGSDGASTVKAHDDLVTTITCGGPSCQPVLHVEKTVTPSGPVAPGTTLHYTIKVTNPGSGAVTGVVATDYLCDKTNYANNANPSPSSAPSVGATGNVVWNIGTLEAGGLRTLTFDAKVRSDIQCSSGGDGDDDDGDVHDGDNDDGDGSHGDDLWGDGGDGDDDDGDNDDGDGGGSGSIACANVVKVYGFCNDVKASAETSVKTDIQCTQETTCKPSLKVEKTVTPYGPVDPGAALHYTIKVKNTGTSSVDAVLVTDKLCDASTYDGRPSVNPQSAPAIGANGNVVWNLGSIEAGGIRTLTFDARIKSDVQCSSGDDGDDDDGDGHGDNLTSGGGDGDDDDGDDNDDGDNDDGDGGGGSSATCVNTVTASGSCGGVRGEASASVSIQINCKTTDGNCPRPCDYWRKECAENTRFTRSQMTAIATKVDDLSAFFNWSSGTDLSRFGSTVNPTTITQRSAAKREFAVLLANSAVGQLHFVATNGAWLKLAPNTPISVTGFTSRTVGALVHEIDGVLANLESRNASDAAVKTRYDQVASVCSGISRGEGISTSGDCDEHDGDDARAATGSSAGSPSGSVALYRAAPNPFTRATQFAYEVTADEASVEITVFDVAGRQVRRLVSTTQPAGRYTAMWDGKSDDGAGVTRGVYFVRTVIAGTKAPVQRLLFLRDSR